ncbi:MAG: dockerin type I repeat-containing protein [Oscillospiraceae bacterium]|nr:dockerin type I repeat-containing protein [Oscillospiraceae bacterium]
MKKQLRHIAVLAAALICCTSCPTANAFHLKGMIGYDEVYHPLQALDDRGLLRNVLVSRSIFHGSNQNTPYYILTYHVDSDPSDPEFYIYGDVMSVFVEKEDAMRIKLREHVDWQEAEPQIQEIVQKYFPDARLSKTTKYANIFVKDEAQRSQERAEGLMRELAQAELICEFNTFGEVAWKDNVLHGFLTLYTATDLQGQPLDYDWTAIEAWVAEHHPECELISFTDRTSDLARRYGTMNPGLRGSLFYAVVPPEDITFSDHFALALELQEQFGLPVYAYLSNLEYERSLIGGQNALESPGDLNIDCTVDVSDAVLAAKFASGDSSAALIDLGKQNGDLNGDENVTLEDVTAILRMIAKLT